MFYKYNTVTKKYEGKVNNAKYNVMTGKLIEGYTDKEPPTIPKGKELFYENGKWVLKDIDYQAIFEKNKQNKLSEVKTKFMDKLNNGIMHSTVLDKDVNARKGIDDINVKSLIELMETDSETTTEYRCADNKFITVTLDQLKTLKIEMIKFGFSLYQKKWQFEAQIEQATTQEELDSIDITF